MLKLQQCQMTAPLASKTKETIQNQVILYIDWSDSFTLKNTEINVVGTSNNWFQESRAHL